MNKKETHVYEANLNQESDLKTFFQSNMIVISTGFFRLESFYLEFESLVLPDIVKYSKKNKKSVSIWSAGCSDGREPYSIAMNTLNWLKKSHSNVDFKIRASDINTQNIKTAIDGCYTLKEKEISRLTEYEDYFQRTGNKDIVLGQKAKSNILFIEEDILKHHASNKYDLIICSNVLLYYQTDYRKQIVQSLIGSLNPNGLLYIETVGDIYLKRNGLKKIQPGSHFYKKMMLSENHY